MKARSTFALTVLFSFLGSVVPAAAQSMRYVDDDASTGGTGRDWEHAYRYLQDALSEASGDPGITEIHVAGGIYKPDQDEAGQVTPGDREATFQLLNGLAIMGGHHGCPGGDCTGDPDERDIALYPSALSGDLGEPGYYSDNCYHVVIGSGTDQAAVLDGVTITMGYENRADPHGRGGGMYNENGAPTLGNCTFYANFARFGGGGMYNVTGAPTLVCCTFRANVVGVGGGGMYNVSSSPTLIQSEFIANSAPFGAGMYNRESSNPTVTGCTFYANWATHDGGGMCNYSYSSPIVTNCAFTENGTDGSGGGLRNADHCDLTLTNCTFSLGYAGEGAGICNQYYSSATLTKCTFMGNYAWHGAGVDCSQYGTMNVINCTFIDNEVGRDGGGVRMRDGSQTLTHCTFSGNSARNGGGIYCATSTSTVTGCLFSGNSADDVGGGIRAGSGDYTLANCVFSSNSATVGGGVADYDSSSMVANCILWGNMASDGVQVFGSATVTYSCVERGWEDQGNIQDDPHFVDADGPDDVAGTQDDNLRLSAGSPCIDAGNNLAVPEDWADLDGDGDTTERTPLDLLGLPRFCDDPATEDTGVADLPDYPAVVDMGAYEYHVPGDLDFDGDIDGDDYSIFAAALPSCAGDLQYNPAADFDGDGCVTLVDYQIWLVLYRDANPPQPAPQPTPGKPGKPGDVTGTAAHSEAGQATGR